MNRETRVAWFPKTSNLKGNPYWELLQRELDALGVAFETSHNSYWMTYRWLWQYRNRVHALHLHVAQSHYAGANERGSFLRLLLAGCRMTWLREVVSLCRMHSGDSEQDGARYSQAYRRLMGKIFAQPDFLDCICLEEDRLYAHYRELAVVTSTRAANGGSPAKISLRQPGETRTFCGAILCPSSTISRAAQEASDLRIQPASSLLSSTTCQARLGASADGHRKLWQGPHEAFPEGTGPADACLLKITSSVHTTLRVASTTVSCGRSWPAKSPASSLKSLARFFCDGQRVVTEGHR